MPSVIERSGSAAPRLHARDGRGSDGRQLFEVGFLRDLEESALTSVIGQGGAGSKSAHTSSRARGLLNSSPTPALPRRARARRVPSAGVARSPGWA